METKSSLGTISNQLILCDSRDTPDADIVGSNLYDRYIKRLHARTGNQINGNMQAQETTNKDPDHDPELPDSRNMPPGTKFHKQTVNDFMGLLVCTGAYKVQTLF